MRVLMLPDGSGLDLSSDGAADSAIAEAHGARGFVPKEDLGRVDLNTFWT